MKASLDVILSVIRWILTLAGTDDCAIIAPQSSGCRLKCAEFWLISASLKKLSPCGACSSLSHKSLLLSVCISDCQ